MLSYFRVKIGFVKAIATESIARQVIPSNQVIPRPSRNSISLLIGLLTFVLLDAVVAQQDDSISSVIDLFEVADVVVSLEPWTPESFRGTRVPAGKEVSSYRVKEVLGSSNDQFLNLTYRPSAETSDSIDYGNWVVVINRPEPGQLDRGRIALDAFMHYVLFLRHSKKIPSDADNMFRSRQRRIGFPELTFFEIVGDRHSAVVDLNPNEINDLQELVGTRILGDTPELIAGRFGNLFGTELDSSIRTNQIRRLFEHVKTYKTFDDLENTLDPATYAGALLIKAFSGPNAGTVSDYPAFRHISVCRKLEIGVAPNTSKEDEAAEN